MKFGSVFGRSVCSIYIHDNIRLYMLHAFSKFWLCRLLGLDEPGNVIGPTYLQKLHHALPHLFEDGDAARVSSMNFTVTLPALSLAARSGRTEILELLLQRCQMDLHKDAPSIAIAAARSGHVSILSQLWKNGITTSPWAKREFYARDECA